MQDLTRQVHLVLERKSVKINFYYTIIEFFYTYLFDYKNYNIESHRHFILSHPHNQLNFYLGHVFTGRGLTMSTGFMLKTKSQHFNTKKHTMKYFKRSNEAIKPILLQFRSLHYYKMQTLFLFECRNFMKKHYLWFSEYLETFKPNIKYIYLGQPYSKGFKKVKRIRRKILRQLLRI